MELTGEGGLLQQLTIWDRARRAGRGRPGQLPQRAPLQDGDHRVGAGRDRVAAERSGSFEPQLVKKRQRRLGGVDEMVLSLSAKGLTHGEISAHLAEVYGTQISKSTISTITDSVMAGMTEWQNRLLDSVYPVVFIDCVNECVYLAVMSLDPTGTGRKRWTMRWEAALQAFDITFDGRLTAGRR